MIRVIHRPQSIYAHILGTMSKLNRSVVEAAVRTIPYTLRVGRKRITTQTLVSSPREQHFPFFPVSRPSYTCPSPYPSFRGLPVQWSLFRKNAKECRKVLENGVELMNNAARAKFKSCAMLKRRLCSRSMLIVQGNVLPS